MTSARAGSGGADSVTVTGLSLAPVKAMRVVAVDEIELGPLGARGNRAFCVIDERGRMVNGKTIASLQTVGAEVDRVSLDELSSSIKALRAGIAVLRSELDHDDASTAQKEAEHAQSGLLPAMTSVREAADTLESMVADDLWPLATYQEMLFIL